MTLRLVLDTNVWLDWLVFDDASVAHLKVLVKNGGAEIWIDPALEAELERVLAYDLGKHSIDARKQAACLSECRRIAQQIHRPISVLDLPRCADPADQMFIEAAVAARADYLVTKDRELLDLPSARLPFRVVQPEFFKA
jgi:putative PIN family toxin of toxin-antitoxin system